MIVEFRMKADINTARWAEMYDTTDQLASDVRSDLRAYVREAVMDKLEADGLLTLGPDGKPVTVPGD